MRIKIKPAGNLFPYLEGEKDMRGDLRKGEPKRLRGDRESAERLLLAQEPAWAKDGDRAYRRVRHHRQHLIHLMNSLDEDQKSIEAALPMVIFIWNLARSSSRRSMRTW
jgi:hypothetical protein